MYITRQQMAARFPGGDALLLQKCDDTKAASAWTPEAEAVCAAEIGAAGNTVDRYIASRYALPLAVVPPSVIDAVVTIAGYRIFLRAGLDAEKDKALIDDYKLTVKWLEQVGRGEILLPVPPPTAAPQKSAVKVAPRTQVFGDLEKY